MSFFTRLYQRVIITIDIDPKTCTLTTNYLNKKTRTRDNRVYKTVNSDLPMEAIKYIRSVKNAYPYTYLSIIARTQEQGLLYGDKDSVFRKFDIDVKNSVIISVGQKWFVYIGKSEINKEMNKYNKVFGVDFVFSPFIVIYESIKNSLDSIKKFYIMQEQYSCTIIIADDNGVYFGKYLVFSNEIFKQEDKEEPQDMQEAIEFDAIANIDENIIIKDFNDSNDKIELQTSGLSELSAANQIISTIRESLDVFYKDDRYASDFIGELVILDAYNMNQNTISHLKNNLFLDIKFVPINIHNEIIKLSTMELNI